LLAIAAEHGEPLGWTAVVPGQGFDIRLVCVFVSAVAHAALRVVEADALDVRAGREARQREQHTPD
jgi:hypothetical protein